MGALYIMEDRNVTIQLMTDAGLVPELGNVVH